jgi:hypothetical protein
MADSNSTIDKLAASSRKRFQSATAGVGILTLVIVLSAILSAVFFWRHSATVFAGLPVMLATGLGLAIGLIPSEGAFFGWKRIRATKADMTKSQLRASEVGLWAAVGFAVANVMAIFISSFGGIPVAVQQVSGWIVFFALMLPIPTQFILYAWFVISEQSVVENHNTAKLNALAHAAYIKTEEARMEAVIQGAEAALNSQLASYGAAVGGENATRALTEGRRDIIGQHYAATMQQAQSAQPAPAQSGGDDIAAALALLAANPQLLSLVRPVDTMSNSTHTGPDTVPPIGHELYEQSRGQGQGNGPAAKMGRDAQNPTSRP